MHKEPSCDDPMHPDRRDGTGKELLRRQAALRPGLPVPSYYVDWRAALCLLLVRATGKLSKRELAQITGLQAYEIAEAMKPVAMIEDLTVEGEYLVRGKPSEAAPVEADNGGKFDAVQQAAIDVLSRVGCCNSVRLKQLATRCKVPCPEVYRAVSELERLGYVRLDPDSKGSLRAGLHYRRQPTKPPGASDPVAVHIRIVRPLVHGQARTEQRIGAVHCELTKDQRRAVLRELVQRDCLEPCLDDRGIPAYRITSVERAEAGLDVLREEKRREARATSAA